MAKRTPKSTRRRSATKSAKVARKAAGNLTRAGRNLRQSAALASNAHAVIAARTRLAAAGDQSEMARMVPEKVIAFSAAGLALADHATRAAFQMSRDARSAWATLQASAAAVARARTPVEAVFVQSRGLWAWWGRMAAQSLDFSARVMGAQHAMTAPVRRAAKANASRLAR